MSKRKRSEKTAALGSLHVTVISLAMDGLNLSPVTEMTKAALLYADRVTIASPSASLLTALASLTLGDERQRMRTLSELASALPGGETIPPMVAYLLSKRHYSREELLVRNRLRESTRELERIVEHQLDEAGAAELAPAIESGVVDIDLLGVDELTAEGDIEIILEHFTKLMETMVSSSSTSHPLFDASASDLLKAMIDEGAIGHADLGPATEISMAKSLISSLEAFPQASMDVVLDVRARLADPLTRFRVAMDDMAREVRVTPVGPAFDAEVRRLYRARVEPALLEIRETIEELGARPTLARAASSGLPTAAISFLVGAALDPADWIKLGAVGGAVVVTAAKEYLKRQEVAKRAKSNEIFFLYAADCALAGR